MNNEQTSRLERRAAVHAALGDVTRLRIVDLLATSDRSSHQIGASLGLPSNLLAHHLGVLEAASLVHRHRSEGDRRRAYVCLDHDTLAVATGAAGTGQSVSVTASRMVFVCTANTARSHLAAALWRSASPVVAISAGTHPGVRVHPGALAAARRQDLDLPDIAPRSLDDVAAEGDVVVTVCDRAYEEVGGSAWAHWSVPDPVAHGTESAFDAAHEDLRRRVAALAEQSGSRPA